MPSTSSQTFNCEYSTNGAFFTWDTSQPSLCLGNLISDGYRWQIPTDGTGTYRVNFGTTSDETIIGFLDDNTINQTSFQTLITGCGWLVRNGKSYVALSPDLSPNSTFTTEKAPRTSVGQFSNGTMILVEVDGCEDLEDGPDLYELADLLTSLGVDSAINLDGGGSSVSVYNGEVIDKPTCNDSPDVCERADASITCVKRSIDRF
jgi:N-acetylglucosamine-1-phosphodiester alpha-N-acetylglucosaminidase